MKINSIITRRLGSQRHTMKLFVQLVAAGAAVYTALSLNLTGAVSSILHRAPQSQQHERVLSSKEMASISGASGNQSLTVTGNSGGTFPWEGSVNNVNLFTGNALTSLPIVSWTALGGLPVNFTLYQNSEGNHDSELGQHWTHTYDIWLVKSGLTLRRSNGVQFFGSAGHGIRAHRRKSYCPIFAPNATIHWGNDMCYTFTGSSLTPPTGVHDVLVANGNPITSYDLTTPDQTKYHFVPSTNTSLGWLCSSITDENGNTITINHNSSDYVTSVVDPTGRTITLGYDSSNRITTITDPLNRQWTLAYDSSNNLQTVTYPSVTVGGVPTSYHVTYGYDSNHDITSFTDKRGNASTYGYNSSGFLTSSTDPASNTTSIGYNTTTLVTTVTDPNSNATTYTLTSDQLTQVKDPAGYHEDYQYDSSNNKTRVTDKNGNAWNYTYDSNGNVLTSVDPYSKTTTYTYNGHGKVLTVTRPLGASTSITYDSNDNVTQIDEKNGSGTNVATTSYTINSYGLITDKYDADGHHYQYGYDTNGDLNSLTTPLGNNTSWGYDTLGVTTSHTDALSHTVTYTRDEWERTTAVAYTGRSGDNKTYTYDANNNLTAYTDITGSTSRTYDAENRMLSESKGGSTVVSHTYDASGEKGLLSTTTDSNGRVITYNYTARNQLYTVSETGTGAISGTTTYAYDAYGNETSINTANGTVVTEGYDNDERQTSVINKDSSATVLSSFTYTYNDDSRKASVTEADGSVVSYGYDAQGHLTSETRTGTNPYTITYTVDGVGNRTSETIGGTTTTFTLDSDDELNSTSGGFTNSYTYDAAGEQTGRTLAGTTYTLAYDYEGQIVSITQGTTTTTFAYDALGRRISRTVGGTTTSFQYDGNNLLLEKQGTSTTATYSYGNALIRKDGEFPLFDALGSERTVTNASQAITGTLNLDSFGNLVGSTGSSTNPYAFAATSHYRNDGDAGLMLTGARYYDSQVGRFITRDPFLDRIPYVYCNGDPVNALDPSGYVTVTIQAPGSPPITITLPPGTVVTVTPDPVTGTPTPTSPTSPTTPTAPVTKPTAPTSPTSPTGTGGTTGAGGGGGSGSTGTTGTGTGKKGGGFMDGLTRGITAAGILKELLTWLHVH